MIFLSPECYPCFLRQADLAARSHGASDAERKAVAARVSGMLAGISSGEVPAGIATRLQALVREELRTDDPFLRIKLREFRRFDAMSRLAERIVSASPDPLSAAVGMSVFGNIMDSGIIERESKEQAVADLAGMAPPEVPEGILERIRGARRIGILLDNAGEAAFDVPLLARLGGEEIREVWIGVKGGPVIDDLTAQEAEGLGLSRYGKIVSNGNRSVGTDLALCAPEFRTGIESSDLVLSKGQANFETLVGRVRNAVFLLRCKCPVVSRALGKKEGEIVILDGAAAA
ncbi:MAG: damage-control phosphatase ARMT1 family protein [Deltaproteobacteria bacterium]|nr:ARMT1-like domain-containing protein [Candidatus Deferrimicrobiaceae bacterium]